MSESGEGGAVVSAAASFRTISPKDAFSLAPPRSPAVLCYRTDRGDSRLVLTEWFSWLNFVRNPMISFSLERSSPAASTLKEDAELVLAILVPKKALKFKEEVVAGHTNLSLSEYVGSVIPADSEILLKCTLASAYNYPFKKVRIFNCNLIEAFRREGGKP